ncbi:MAG: ABC transporter permease [Myxococcales bacterium]
MNALFADLKLALRRLRQRPGFTLAAAFALALGIGSTTSVYSVLQAVVLKPLPYRDPGQLLLVWESQPAIPNASISAPDFRDWREQAKTVEMSAYTGDGFNLTGRDKPERLSAAITDANFFHLLGPRMVLGRAYQPGATREVVLGEGIFHRVFGGDPKIVGTTITLNGSSYLVDGVLAKDDAYPPWAEIWAAPDPGRDLPLLAGFDPDLLNRRGAHFLRGVARLERNATLQAARAELEGIGARLEQANPGNKGHRAALDSMQTVVVGPIAPSLWMLFGGVVLVLLIACANVAGLQLAQAASRQREIATRMALGASRGQLVRQLLSESVLLSLLGGALGLLFSIWGVNALTVLAGRGLPRAGEVSIDWGVLGFTLGVSVLAGMLGGLAPALLASRGGNLTALKDASPAGFGRARLRSGLIVAEVALALVLLAGAGLLARSFLALRAVDPGFDPENVLTARLARSNGTGEQAVPFFDELLRRLSALPGVRAAGAVKFLPMTGNNTNSDISIEGQGKPTENDRHIVEFQIIAGDYFNAMGVPLLAGRIPGPQDARKGGPKVAVINRAMAQRFWKGEDAIGKRFSQSDDGGPGDDGWIEVIGVVGDIHQFGLGQPPRPEAYLPLSQTPTPSMQLAVKASGDRNALAAGLRREVSALDPDQPLWSIQPLEELLGQTLQARRASTLLLAVFSGLALLLSVLGIYAMMAYAVVQRTREIGVRMALGAESGGVVRLVVRQGMRLALLGVGIGLPAALALAQLISTQLYGIASVDVPTYVGTSAVLSAAALVACWMPARVAARVDPIVALRAE